MRITLQVVTVAAVETQLQEDKGGMRRGLPRQEALPTINTAVDSLQKMPEMKVVEAPLNREGSSVLLGRTTALSLAPYRIQNRDPEGHGHAVQAGVRVPRDPGVFQPESQP